MYVRVLAVDDGVQMAVCRCQYSRVGTWVPVSGCLGI